MDRPKLRRGLQIMRTQSTRKTGSLTSPEMYIRLTSLEMERARRVLERDRLLERVRVLDERIASISQEQIEMRERVDRLSNGQTATEPSAKVPAGRSEPPFGFTY